VVREGLTIKHLNNSSSEVNLTGIVYESKEINDYKILSGRYYTENEIILGSNYVIIGYKIMEYPNQGNMIYSYKIDSKR